MAGAEEVPAASPKQRLGGKPERGKTFYGREGHPPSHLVEPPQGKDTPLRGGELQGGDQRGGGWGPEGWGTSGPMLRLREAHGPRNLHSFEGGGHTGPTEAPRDGRGRTSPKEGKGLEGGRWSRSRFRDRRFPSSACSTTTTTTTTPSTLSLSCQARERTTKWGIPQLAFGHTPDNISLNIICK